MSDTWHRKAIAITGIVGSGKSTAAQILREMGGYVVSADELARKAVEPGSKGLEQVVALFGSGVLLPSGALNREALAKRIFASPADRKQLEEILHPIIGELSEAAFQSTPPNTPAFYDCPLLFEAGLHHQGFRNIILITAPDAVIQERLRRDRGWSDAEILDRTSSQIPLNEKVAQSDIVVENSGTPDELREKLAKVWSSLHPSHPK